MEPNYKPLTFAFASRRYCWAPEEPQRPHLLPMALFEQLKGGVLMPESRYFLASRTYNTEAEALSDLEQAKQISDLTPTP